MKEVRDILQDHTKTKEEKIDELLRIDSFMYTNLGLDSSDEEKISVYEKSEYIYKRIKELDEVTGNQLLNK